MRTDNAADIRLNAMLENFIFYISRTLKFSHSLDPKRSIQTKHKVANEPKEISLRGRAV